MTEVNLTEAPDGGNSHGDGMVLSLWRGLIPTFRRPTIAGIKAEVAARYGVTVADLEGQSRVKIFVAPRHEAMWLCWKEARWSQPTIGYHFGRRDHTTVIHARRAHEKRMADAKAKAALAAMEAA